jgi:hypothetical protein
LLKKKNNDRVRFIIEENESNPVDSESD